MAGDCLLFILLPSPLSPPGAHLLLLPSPSPPLFLSFHRSHLLLSPPPLPPPYFLLLTSFFATDSTDDSLFSIQVFKLHIYIYNLSDADSGNVLRLHMHRSYKDINTIDRRDKIKLMHTLYMCLIKYFNFCHTCY